MKNELSQAISENTHQPSKSINTKQIINNQTQQQMEQTILALRRVIERLKVENKKLRDTKIFSKSFSLGNVSNNNKDDSLIGVDNNNDKVIIMIIICVEFNYFFYREKLKN